MFGVDPEDDTDQISLKKEYKENEKELGTDIPLCAERCHKD